MSRCFSFIAVRFYDLTDKTARTFSNQLRYVLARWHFYDLLKFNWSNQSTIDLFKYCCTSNIAKHNILNNKIETKWKYSDFYCLNIYINKTTFQIRINLISNYNLVLKRKQNKINHTKYGNQNKGIKLAHLNKSSSNILTTRPRGLRGRPMNQ